MLNRYELVVAKEESERVDTLRYSWQKLQSLAVNTFFRTNCLHEICNGCLPAVVSKTKQNNTKFGPLIHCFFRICNSVRLAPPAPRRRRRRAS